ncbi:hypothetical protein [Bartonella apihabitans]|uniref:hypothetical protein n=1 Tax=Bartonella apihabitans TaxID=2750929 RepID=UPI00122E025A|nr:hypothetical protein [Bartonella apihabitans]
MKVGGTYGRDRVRSTPFSKKFSTRLKILAFPDVSTPAKYIFLLIPQTPKSAILFDFLRYCRTLIANNCSIVTEQKAGLTGFRFIVSVN